jgi:peptidoglycan/xylan/chitin deacetylase (PgdA/CDA1 family)
MALPANVDLVTVTGTFYFIDGTEPDASTVEFRPDGNPWLKDASARAILMPKTVVCTINASGQLVGPATAVGAGGVGVTLPAADDPDLAPNGWVYDVTIKTAGLPELKYSISLTTANPTVDLSELAPVSPVEGGALLVTSVNSKLPNMTGVVVLTASNMEASPSTYMSPPAPVQRINSKTGDVALTAADVGAPPVNRRGLLKAGAVLAVVGAGAAAFGTGTAAARYQTPATADTSYAPQMEVLRPTLTPKGALPLMTVPANIAGHAWTKTGGQGTVDLNDTTDVMWGTQAVKVTSPGTNSTDCHVTASGLTLDLTGRDPVLWVKVDDVTKLRALEVRLGDATFANFYFFEFEAKATASRNDRYLRSGKWHRLVLPWGAKSVDTGTPNRAVINKIQVSPLDYGTGAATVHIGGFGYQPQATEYPNGVCVFIFDDGYLTQFTVARPYLDKYGFPATALPIVDIIGTNANYMTVAQLKELQDMHSWEVGAHAYTQGAHNAAGAFTSLSASALDDELRLNKMWLRENGFRGYDLHAYPQGLYNDAVISAVGSYYGVSRSQHSYRRDTLPPTEPLRLRTFNLGSTQTLASAKAAVDEAAANKELLIYTLHDLVSPASTGNQWTPSDFQALVDYVASKNMAVRTLGDALRRI